MKSNYITREGWDKLDQELKYLWKDERPKITRSVSEAAAQGDRSENAEYIYGKKRLREIDRLIHPNAIFPIKLNRRPVPGNIIEAVWGFFSIYVIVFMCMLLMLVGTGMDFITAFSAVGAAINNLGPGLGDVAHHYGDIEVSAKLLLCFAMMLGRLDIFTLLVLFSPMFWRK